MGLRSQTVLLCTLALWGLAASRGWGQQPAGQDNQAAQGDQAAPSQGDQEEGPGRSDTTVGYIDPAVPLNMLRFDYDGAYDDNRPSRAEYFYAKPQVVGGPGPPGNVTKINYQQFMPHLEFAPWRTFSAFLEVPFLYLDPEPFAGFGNMRAGFKWAFVARPNLFATFQTRIDLPTGFIDHGLGTGHVSLEPALLVNKRWGRLLFEGEFRDWVPLGGTDFAGNVTRYGVGLSYRFGRGRPGVPAAIPAGRAFWVAPVTEVVGWTVLSGKEAVILSDNTALVKRAAGDTIVNLKLGVRMGLTRSTDLYLGYGRALTGAVWYKDLYRLELRWFY